MKKAKILMVEDDTDVLAINREFFMNNGYEVFSASTLDGVCISLTKKELQLLGCFVLYAGRRLSSDEIYRRAWGESSKNASHTVAVHVANLRKMLFNNK